MNPEWAKPHKSYLHEGKINLLCRHCCLFSMARIYIFTLKIEFCVQTTIFRLNPAKKPIWMPESFHRSVQVQLNHRNGDNILYGVYMVEPLCSFWHAISVNRMQFFKDNATENILRLSCQLGPHVCKKKNSGSAGSLCTFSFEEMRKKSNGTSMYSLEKPVVGIDGCHLNCHQVFQ